MKIVALAPDLFFKSKIAETAKQVGKEVHFVEDPLAVKGAGVVFVDLEKVGVEGLQHVQAANPGVKIIGFCSHLDGERMQRAFAIGVQALPRATFVNQLPSLLSLY